MTAHAGATFISLADTPFKGKKKSSWHLTQTYISKKDFVWGSWGF